MSAVDVIIKILEIVVWPSTLFGVILVFRKQFNNAMGRLGSFEANAAGVSMSFEPKLDQAKEVFGQLRSAGKAKSAPGGINQQRLKGTPMEQVAKLHEEIDATLIALAKENHIDLSGKSTPVLCNELTNKGIIAKEKGRLLHALLEVLNSANAYITQQQVDEILEMYNSI
jgi:nucleotide-binding universal stress UspA family protein